MRRHLGYAVLAALAILMVGTWIPTQPATANEGAI